MRATPANRTRPVGLGHLCVALAVMLWALPVTAQQIMVFETHAPVGGQWEGDIDVSAQRMSPGGEAMWNDGNLIDIMSGSYIEQAAAVVSDGADGAIVFAEAVAREGQYVGDWEILAQRIDGRGRLLWNDGESSVVVASTTWSERHPTAVPDGSGGAFVFYEAHAPAGSEWAGDIDIRGQHISRTGELLWDEGGVPIATASAMLEQTPFAISDGAGGAIVVYQLVIREGEFANVGHIGAQHVSADGRLLWGGGDSSVVVAASEWDQRRPVAVPDGAGGALVFCEAGAPPGSEWAGDIDVHGQRVSADGQLMWNDGDSSVIVHSSAYLEVAPVAVSDGNGGAIVVCSAVAAQGEYAGDWEILAQRVSATGELLWNDGERATIVSATKLHERGPCALADGAGGAFVAFQAYFPEGMEYGGDIDIYAQRLSADGQVMWSDEGDSLPVATGRYLEQAPCIVSDGAGGVVIAFEAAARTGEYAGDWEALAQRVAPDGTLLWNDGESSSIISVSRWGERHLVTSEGGIGARDMGEADEMGGVPGDAGPPQTNRTNPVKP